MFWNISIASSIIFAVADVVDSSISVNVLPLLGGLKQVESEKKAIVHS